MDKVINELYKKIVKNNDKVVVFGLSTCGYCKSTIKYLKEKNIPYKFYNINKIYNIFFKLLLKVKELHPELSFEPNHKTVPVIFYNEFFIGGYSDLIKNLHI
jgi:glutaredoxin